MGSTRHVALYFLEDASFDSIYSPVEQSEIAARVDVLETRLTAETYEASNQDWPEVEMIFSGWGMVPMDEAFLRRFPNLKAVFYGAGSAKAITSDAFWDREILITTAYAANAIPVAEFTLSQILYSLKRGWQQVFWVRRHRRFPTSMEIQGAYGSTVGLVSLGMVGRRVAELLKHFDLQVLAYDPTISSAVAAELNVELVSLEDIFRRSDVVSCHTPLLDATRKMIGRRYFEMMKQNATFLNTSRGAVVVEEEMIQCLRKRSDLLAVLDVTFPEPPVESSPLYTLENVILTPHIAGSLGAECRRMGRIMVEELDRFLDGKPLRYGLNRERSLMLA